MRHRFHFYIDVIGACNLKCPSCPVGNSPEVENPRGAMEPEFLDRILTKARRECEVSFVGLYNWTEPMLHPRLAELVRVVHSHGLKCMLSANLNLARNFEEVLRECPEILRVSLSGFTQETYGVTHRGGQIERVKSNMAELGRLKRELGSTTRLQACYLRYRSNLHEEEPMREFALAHGYEFESHWAVMLPLEKVLGHRGEPGYPRPNEADEALIDLLALPLDAALDAARANRNRRCALLEDQVTIDVSGNVQLCCAVFDASRFTLANFLETPLKEIQSRRHRSKVCGVCMKHAVHDYYVANVPDVDRLARENVAARQAAPSGERPA